MSIFSRFLITALIVFTGGSCGLYYIMGNNQKANDFLDSDSNIRRLNLSEQALIKNKSFIDSEPFNYSQPQEDLLNLEEEDLDDWDYEEDVSDHEVKEGVMEKQTSVPLNTEDEKKIEERLGPKIVRAKSNNSSIPVPRKLDGSEIREKEFEFKNVPKDEQFEEKAMQKLPEDSLVKTSQEYLILASSEHELWSIKHQQLQDYLKEKRITSFGIREWRLDLNTTKEELANKCFAAIKKNPRNERVSRAVKASVGYSFIWTWCTLPQYWGQEKPENW